MTTIVVADDRTIIRQDLRALLEAAEDFSVVGESADGLEVTALVERLRPDVLVLDLLMPGINGIEVSWQVRRRAPNTNVIILSILANEPYVIAALSGGADGYVPVDASAVDSLQAVQNAIIAVGEIDDNLDRPQAQQNEELPIPISELPRQEAPAVSLGAPAEQPAVPIAEISSSAVLHGQEQEAEQVGFEDEDEIETVD